MSGTVAGRLAFDGTRVRVEDLTADTKPGRVVLSGWADVIGDRPAVAANATATLNIAEAARLAHVETRGQLLMKYVRLQADAGKVVDPTQPHPGRADPEAPSV